MVSLDGTECNRIGTSYEAFQTQPNACNSPVGTCLANQIRDLVNADQALLGQGLDQKYNFTVYQMRDQLEYVYRYNMVRSQVQGS